MYVEKKLELLDQFMGRTDFPEFADQPQRDFLDRVIAVKDCIRELKYPIGMIDKYYLKNFLKGNVPICDELVDFFYHAVRARKFTFRFTIDEDKFNYELSTIWNNTNEEPHSYGKIEVEDLSYLL